MSVIRVEEAGQNSLSRAEKLLAGMEGCASKAIKDAMQRAVSKLRTESGKVIREKYDISAADIRTNENVTVKYSYGSGVTAFVNFHGYKIPLYRYGGAFPKTPRADTGKLVSAMIKGKWVRVHPGVAASGHQLLGTSPTKLENAFVVQMASGHIGIFERTGGMTADKSDAIREIMGSSVPQMLGNKEVQEKLTEEAMGKFEDRLEDNINRILSGQWR